ncbi:MAG TPA: hypothetical protein VNO21_08365 [Polyangiaceae bacterium]|nr:hypothetical protein [Polyangiaceae bacterium]
MNPYPCSPSENRKRFAALAFSRLRIELGRDGAGEVSDAAVEKTLTCAAEAALAFGRSTAFSAADDMVFVDVTGCEHLHAQSNDPSGARTLAERLQKRILALGHVVRVAVARGPRMAAAFARYAHTSSGMASGMASESGIELETDDQAFARLPLAALALDAANLDWLGKLGLSTIADLRKLPPAALGARLGRRDVMALLRGEDETPIEPYTPPEQPEESLELEYGIDSNESILFAAKTLCARLSARLLGRTKCAAHLELVLALDRALLPERSGAEPPRIVFSLVLASPLRTEDELLAVLRARIESYVLPAPVLAVSLRAVKLVDYELRARDLFVPETRAELALPRLVSELTAELGEGKVGMFTLENHWSPALRAPSALSGYRQRAGKNRTQTFEARLVSRGIEPVRFLKNPIRYSGLLPKGSFFARSEAVAWWQSEDMPACDDLAIFVPELGAVAWVVRDRRTKRMFLWGYIEHG